MVRNRPCPECGRYSGRHEPGCPVAEDRGVHVLCGYPYSQHQYQTPKGGKSAVRVCPDDDAYQPDLESIKARREAARLQDPIEKDPEDDW